MSQQRFGVAQSVTALLKCRKRLSNTRRAKQFFHSTELKKVLGEEQFSVLEISVENIKNYQKSGKLDLESYSSMTERSSVGHLKSQRHMNV